MFPWMQSSSSTEKSSVEKHSVSLFCAVDCFVFHPSVPPHVSSWANKPHLKESLYVHQALAGLPDQSRDEQQTKSEGPCAGAVDPSSGKLCLMRKLSSRFVNLRNLQSAMFSSQAERCQTAPHTAWWRKPTRQLIEHLGTLAKQINSSF